MARRDRTARLLRVQHLLYLHPRGLRAAEIADRCSMSVRTAYRDLRALQTELECPIWEDGDGRFGLESAHFLPPLKLSLLEATALFLSARLMSRYADERDPNVQSALEKLATILPAPIASHVQATAAAMAERPANLHFTRVLDTLARAWAESRPVEIDYQRPGVAASTRVLEPYFLEPSAAGHSCYVIGQDRSVEDRRTFKVERILDARLLDEQFELPAGWDAQAHLRGSWGIYDDPPVTIRLRFSPAAAPRVREAVWHPSQAVRDTEDDGLEFTVTVNGETEIMPWILSWGAEVEVLEPASLREHCASTAGRLAAAYSRPR